jgi:hypothetical protein
MKEVKITTHVIPAAPGYQAFQWEVRDGVVHIDPSPIIAWVVREPVFDNRALPVTDDNLDLPGVLRPDGRLFLLEYHPQRAGWRGGDWYDSLDEFKADVLKQAEARPENPPAI